jgi:hypothetical protein
MENLQRICKVYYLKVNAMRCKRKARATAVASAAAAASATNTTSTQDAADVLCFKLSSDPLMF